jgi:hypothetical protein
MTEAVEIALIVSAAPTLVGVGAIVGQIRNRKAIAEVKGSITEIHLSLNSRLSELVEAAKAVGAQEERDKRSVTVEGVPKVNPQ